MKSTHVLIALIPAAALVFTGCGQKEETTTATPPTEAKQPATPPAPAAPPSVPQAATDAAKAVEAQKPAVEKAAADVTTQLDAAAKAAAAQPQTLIDKAKAFVADKKYDDALALIKQLASLKLTPEQQKAVDALQTEIKNAAAGKAAESATKAVGDILGGKK